MKLTKAVCSGDTGLVLESAADTLIVFNAGNESDVIGIVHEARRAIRAQEEFTDLQSALNTLDCRTIPF